MEVNQFLQRNWEILERLLPPGWEALARSTGAVRRLRGFASESVLLRVLLLHVGPSLSLRETSAQAQLESLADVSDVAIMDRLRQCEPWLRALCQLLLAEAPPPEMPPSLRLRAVDATTIHEPGPTGSTWRLHFSMRLPDFHCDQFDLTPGKGKGGGETLQRFKVLPGDVMCADRGLCHPAGIAHVVRADGDVLLRAKPTQMGLRAPDGKPFPLWRSLAALRKPGQVGHWEVAIVGPRGLIAGRLCALRKSATQTRRETRRLQHKARRRQSSPSKASLRLSGYVLVFTTLKAAQITPAQVLELYRWRWQIELLFKRLKSLAKMGHLPKKTPGSARAWLYGKILIALMAQKLSRHGRDFSPWGYPQCGAPAQRVA